MGAEPNSVNSIREREAEKTDQKNQVIEWPDAENSADPEC